MSKPTEKLLRPLHRRRTRRRSRAVVLGGNELAAHYQVPLAELETFLTEHTMKYHKDSRGELWASVSERPLS